MALHVHDNSTTFNTMISTVPTQIHEQLPEEEKKDSFSKMLIYIPSLAAGFWALWHLYANFLKVKEALDSRNNIIDKGSTDQSFIDVINYQQTISTLCDPIDYHERFLQYIAQLKEIISKCPETLDVKESFKNAINEAKQKMARKVIRDSTQISLVFIGTQLIKLYIARRETFKAEDLHQYATKFQENKEHIEAIRAICNDFVQPMQTEDIQRLSQIMCHATVKYNETKSLISDLRFKIHRSVQRLDLFADMQVLDGVSNVAMTIGNAVQLYSVRRSVSPCMTFIDGVLVFVFSLIAIGNGVTYNMTRRRLNELRTDLQQLKNYEGEVEKIYKKIEDVDNWPQQQ